ncbi:hypothetical protein LTR62_002073 [Meristemomyces frigidus]|uniref:Uncharacterized protein n=1 Tax=Meristemomyces frigidus TaxID=1508187 RepID=A0AAN7TFY5_9PEZI|nr:hypothetical protein LTR62_002073 [Meristemomyces frigidus]
MLRIDTPLGNRRPSLRQQASAVLSRLSGGLAKANKTPTSRQQQAETETNPLHRPPMFGKGVFSRRMSRRYNTDVDYYQQRQQAGKYAVNSPDNTQPSSHAISEVDDDRVGSDGTGVKTKKSDAEICMETAREKMTPKTSNCPTKNKTTTTAQDSTTNGYTTDKVTDLSATHKRTTTLETFRSSKVPSLDAIDATFAMMTPAVYGDTTGFQQPSAIVSGDDFIRNKPIKNERFSGSKPFKNQYAELQAKTRVPVIPSNEYIRKYITPETSMPFRPSIETTETVPSQPLNSDNGRARPRHSVTFDVSNDTIHKNSVPATRSKNEYAELEAKTGVPVIPSNEYIHRYITPKTSIPFDPSDEAMKSIRRQSMNSDKNRLRTRTSIPFDPSNDTIRKDITPVIGRSPPIEKLKGKQAWDANISPLMNVTNQMRMHLTSTTNSFDAARKMRRKIRKAKDGPLPNTTVEVRLIER